MSEITAQIPVSELIPLLTAIADRHWESFKVVEKQFVTKHGVEVWEDFFAFRLKPALDKESDRWLLVQWCSKGFTVKDVA
ncbi:hypothetical protein H6G80_29945 [Nostoc sp. FACHB-87]|uniref:hypothetical protein n=1 Tax=Nostocaceae TaxID=1162 RepID=UPI0016869EA2|nr:MULTISPECIES: hypothetical protein [Nostocaceae]MBD2303777.1 hypothetical protein [Nostoc sp. FACHB-190]MBD2458276.1 hypothetical protein [Nostoc sp. FACHB-87]MBD2480061.1 hypothetical protein [Anabaena sp. FACHB-83]